MKNKKIFLQLFLAVCMICFACTGCVSTGDMGDSGSSTGQVSSEPGALERQGLAFSRIICSPLNMVGFTVAECENIGGASAILFPFICCWTIPAGALAMTGDVITGTFEMLFWQQFKSVTYPWDSFNYEAAKPYCDFTKALLVAALTGAAEGAVEGAVSGATGSSSSYTSSSSSYSGSSSKRFARAKHSSCRGTGICNICKGKGRVGADKRCVCGGSGICRPCNGTGESR